MTYLLAFLASHGGDIEARIGKPRKKHVLQIVFFSFFPPSLLPTGGDIQARMSKPRKNHVLQSVVFSFFPPSLLLTGPCMILKG